MDLTCARLNCDQHATATLAFDAANAMVILIDLSETTDGIPICRLHARTRTAPVGWTLDDRRTLVQSSLDLDTKSGADGAAADGTTDGATSDDDDASPRRRVPMIHRTASFAPLERGPDVRPAVRRAAAPSLDLRGGQADRTPPGLAGPAPSSPLLSRAFRGIT